MRDGIVIDDSARAENRQPGFRNQIEHDGAEIGPGAGQQVHVRRHTREVGQVAPALGGVDVGPLQTSSFSATLEIAQLALIPHRSETAANIARTKGMGLKNTCAVTNFLLLVLVLLGAALYFMTAVERTRFLQAVVATFHTVSDAVTWQTAQNDPFFSALRERSPRVVATPVLIVLSAIIFIFAP